MTDGGLRQLSPDEIEAMRRYALEHRAGQTCRTFCEEWGCHNVLNLIGVIDALRVELVITRATQNVGQGSR